MLLYEDFQETSQVQATVFTPSFVFSTSEMLRKLMELELDVFDGDPFVLPLPDDAPNEIPRIILEKKDKSYKLEVAPARINFFRNKIVKGDKIVPNEFLRFAADTLSILLHNIGTKCGRIAALINRFAYKDDPGKEIAVHFCQHRYVEKPFNRPGEFELHSLKQYPFESFEVNSWVRIKSGRIKTNSGAFRPGVIVQQDVNTSTEIQMTYKSDHIVLFYDKILTEFDDILKLYFPK